MRHLIPIYQTPPSAAKSLPLAGKVPNECEADEVERESLPSARRKIPASPAKPAGNAGIFASYFCIFANNNRLTDHY